MFAISNLKYAHADHSAINMMVSTGGDPFPFTYSPTDTAPVSVEVKALLAERTFDIAEYVAPLSPPAPMSTLTRKQVILGLLADGFITSDEAVAAAQTGAEPAAIKAIFDASITDPVQRASATVTWAAMRDVLRTDPLTLMIQASRNMTDAEVDAMWLRWAAL